LDNAQNHRMRKSTI